MKTRWSVQKEVKKMFDLYDIEKKRMTGNIYIKFSHRRTKRSKWKKQRRMNGGRR